MKFGALSVLRFRFVVLAALTILPVLILIVYTASLRRELDGRELLVAAGDPVGESDSGATFYPMLEPAIDGTLTRSDDASPGDAIANDLAPPLLDRKSPNRESCVETTRWAITGAGAFRPSIGGLVDEVAAAEGNKASGHSRSTWARQVSWRHLWIAAMVLWLGLVGAWLRSDLSILHGVELLAAAAKRIVSGDLATRAAVHQSKDELNQLVSDFNAMAAALQLKDEKPRSEAMDLQKSYAGLERSKRAKSDFVSLMSHELRTPLSLIIGHAGMMQDGLLGQVTEEQRNSLDQIVRCSDELLAIVTSILQASSIESGVIRLQTDEFNPCDLLEELKSECVPVKEKEVHLIWNYPSNLPTVKTDREKLKHVLQTLIDNAIKFTDEGQVVVSLASFAEQGKVEFNIADTGIGIPSEALPLVFEKFRQLDSSITRQHGGVGLGLFIAKRFTELLGGELVVSSALGKGSTFTVTLPIAG
ncbi:MAG TPA: HAMP domain-containing sensor histidine kinase [Candidatus Binatia bacterium]|nr:HAMP domain-containing sensor histidine kinase [Candidatus Binatia bacterium]